MKSRRKTKKTKKGRMKMKKMWRKMKRRRMKRKMKRRRRRRDGGGEKENSRKSVTWSAVPYAPLLVSLMLAI